MPRFAFIALLVSLLTAPGLAAQAVDTSRSPLLTPSDRFTQAIPYPSLLGEAPPEDGAPVLWSDAPRHRNHQITVVGTVLSTGQAQNGYPKFLRFKDAPRREQPFEIVLFDGADTGIPHGEPATSYYLGKTIKLTHTVTTYRGNPQMAVEEPGVIQVVDAEDYAHLGVRPAPPHLDTPLITIPWHRAKDHVGQTVTVTGRVVATFKSQGDPDRNDDGAIFFNFDRDYRGKFHLIMFPDAYTRFPGPPETLFRERQVSVTGTITEHRGTPQMQIERPAQIRARP